MLSQRGLHMAGLLPTHKTTPACVCRSFIPSIVSLSTHSMNTRLPYSGPFRKLVLAFDVGTTYSGISYWSVF
jgi:hypothetical protein